MVDEHISEHINIFEHYKKIIENHKEFFKQFHQEVESYVKNKNIRWLNSVFILIIRSRDYRYGGEGHKMLYFALLFNFFDALYKTDCAEYVEFYKYVVSKLSNDYGYWKDLRTIFTLLENIDIIKDEYESDDDNDNDDVDEKNEENKKYSIDYTNIKNF